MTKIIMNGCNGKMGQVITRLVSEDNECEIVAGFDVNDSIENTYPVFTNPDEFTGDADVIIDFSHPSALTTVLNYCKKRKLPVILATTGYTDEQKKEFTEASKEIPVFFSANMSLGINLIIALAKKATKLLEGNFDIEIVERHHNQKLTLRQVLLLLLLTLLTKHFLIRLNMSMTDTQFAERESLPK